MNRKIKSKEYCHNCGKDSEWVFEDRPGNQIIECPECGHKHYRVVTGELVRPEIKYEGRVITDVKSFLKKHPELKDTFQKLEEEAEENFKVSDERWGQDPSQGAGISFTYASTGTSWSSSSTSATGYVYNTTTAWDYTDSSNTSYGATTTA